ncbi:MAG: hypothetical protein AAGK05_14595 [Pseudomonadota bacterium]
MTNFVERLPGGAASTSSGPSYKPAVLSLPHKTSEELINWAKKLREEKKIFDDVFYYFKLIHPQHRVAPVQPQRGVTIFPQGKETRVNAGKRRIKESRPNWNDLFCYLKSSPEDNTERNRNNIGLFLTIGLDLYLINTLIILSINTFPI